MKSKVLLIAVFFTLSVSAQNKYWINLKDKSASVSKSDLKSIFSEKALYKKLSEPNQIDWYDYPVKSDYLKQIENSGAKIVNQSRWLNAVSVLAADEQISQISKLPFVKSVESVVKFKTPKIVASGKQEQSISKISSLNYGSSANQNNLTKLSSLHKLGISGKGIVVGVIDAGFKVEGNSALDNVTILEYKNFVNNPSNSPSHGTAVLSMMGANKPGNLIGGTFGSEFYLAETEFTPTETTIEEDNWVSAIEWMEAKGADIVNSSLGYLIFDDSPGKPGYSYSDMNGKTAKCTIAADIAASKKGVAVFIASGNEGPNAGTLSAPSDGFHVFSSGAVASTATLAVFSSRGPSFDGRIKPDGLSMGVSNAYATTGGGYSSGNGTSFASPMSTCAGSLILSVYPELLPDQLYNALRSTADKTNSPNNDYGYGLIDAEKALYKIGPAVSNQFSISYSGSTLSFSGMLKWDESISLTQTKLILYKSVNDSSVIDNPTFSGDSVTFSGNFNANVNDTILFKITGKTVSDKSFSWPLNNDFRRVWVYAETKTRASDLRRSGKFGSKYFTDTTEQKPKPVTFEISNLYPNPFNPETRFSVFSAKATGYSVTVYNAMGQLVDSFDGQLYSNDYKIISWNTAGKNAASGLYFIRFTAGEQNKLMKAVLIK